MERTEGKEEKERFFLSRGDGHNGNWSKLPGTNFSKSERSVNVLWGILNVKMGDGRIEPGPRNRDTGCPVGQTRDTIVEDHTNGKVAIFFLKKGA